MGPVLRGALVSRRRWGLARRLLPYVPPLPRLPLPAPCGTLGALNTNKSEVFFPPQLERNVLPYSVRKALCTAR